MNRRTAGTLLMLLGVLGIILSALGVIAIWRAADGVTVAADDTLVLIDDTLKDVDSSLDVASGTLDGAALAMDGVYTTTLEVSGTLSNTRITMEEMARLTEEDLPQSIEASLVALEALQETAAVIDEVLRGLQRLGVGDYEPETPLDQAVAETGAGLEPVPNSLRAMGAGLHQTSDGLKDVQGGLELMGDNIMGIRQNVVAAEGIISSHRSTLAQLQTRVRTSRQGLERPIQAVAWAATLLLIWIAFSQLAIVRWGHGLWRRPARPGQPRDTVVDGRAR